MDPRIDLNTIPSYLDGDLREISVPETKTGSGISTAQAYEPDNVTAKDSRQTNNGKPPRKRPYKPRMGVSREKNKETQKRYRERLKNKSSQTHVALDVLAAKVKALRLEQEKLLTEHSTLECLRQYADSAIGVLRTAASSATSLASSATRVPAAAHASLMSIYADMVECLWIKLRRPSDDQLREVIHSGAEIQTMHPAFVSGLGNLLAQWSSSPASRVLVERKLALIFETRSRFVSIAMQERPEKIIRIMLAFSPSAEETSGTSTTTAGQMGYNGTTAQFNYGHVAQRDYLLDKDLIAATAMREEQRIALLRHWKVYTNKYSAAKRAILEAPSELATSITTTTQGAASGELIGNSSHAAKGLLAAKGVIDELNGYTTEELLARVELMIGTFRVLTPLQRAYVILGSVPHPNIVSMCKSLLRLDVGLNDGVLVGAFPLLMNGGSCIDDITHESIQKHL